MELGEQLDYHHECSNPGSTTGASGLSWPHFLICKMGL